MVQKERKWNAPRERSASANFILACGFATPDNHFSGRMRTDASWLLARRPSARVPRHLPRGKVAECCGFGCTPPPENGLAPGESRLRPLNIDSCP